MPTSSDALAVPGTPSAVDAEPGIETVRIDTVEHAAAMPNLPQPYRELGLADDEYARIREILGRRPTSAELSMTR